MLSSFSSCRVHVAGMAPKRDRRAKKEKEVDLFHDGKIKFTDCVEVLFAADTEAQNLNCVDDPYAFHRRSGEMMPQNIATAAHTFNSFQAQAVAKGPSDRVSKYIADNVVSLEPTGSPPRPERPKLPAAPRASKAVKLQAKIAQNRMVDKFKASQESSPSNTLGTCVKAAAKAKDVQKSHPALDVGTVTGKVARAKTAAPRNKAPTARAVSQDVKKSIALGADQAKGFGMSLPSPVTFQLHEDEALKSAKLLQESLTWKRPPIVNAEECPQVVSIQPNVPKVLNGWMRPENIPKPVLAIQNEWEKTQKFRTDHYPLGPETSDSSDSSDSDCDLSQNHWFSMWNMDPRLKADSSADARTAGLSLLRCNQRQQHGQLHYSRGTTYHEDRLRHKLCLMILNASRSHPLRTGQLLQLIKSTRTCIKANTTKKCIGLVKQNCCYSNEAGACVNYALPYTRHCIKHIMYNVDQLLFEHCTAKFADNTQCCLPVFDISHELPLCVEHARKRDNYNKMTLEPKAKKPRKKTKPSALTRPPKRGKKKKKQVASTSGKSPVLSSADESRSSFKYSVDSTQLNANDNCLNAEQVEEEMSNQLEPDLGNDLEGQLSPGTDLPLDAADLANQASHLLEEHDFTDVLNKIPEDAFNDLFSEPKNGDFLQTEELVRALSVVGKECKLMDKISSEGIGDSGGPMDHLLQSDDMDGTMPLYTQGSITMDNLSAITSTLTSSELNSISQALSSMTSEAGPQFTSSGSSPARGMNSIHETHSGDGTPGNFSEHDGTVNFLGSSIELSAEVYTQVFPRNSILPNHNARGSRNNHWSAQHSDGRVVHHSHSQNGLVLNFQAYTQHLDEGMGAAGKATIMSKENVVTGDGFGNMEHSHCHSQATGLASKFKSLPSGESAFSPNDVPS